MFTTKFLISFALYSLLQSLAETASGKPTVDGLTACKRNDPKLNECLLNMFKQAKPNLMQGDPKLNLPPLDPVHLHRIFIHKTLEGIQINGELSDFTAKGARTIAIRTLKMNLSKNTLDMVLMVPIITFITEFNLSANLNTVFLPISGSGRCNGKISDSNVQIHINTEAKDGNLKMDDIKVKLDVGDLEVQMVKPYYPSIAQTALQFFDSDKRMILELMTPIAEDVIQQLLFRYGNKILPMIKSMDLLVD